MNTEFPSVLLRWFREHGRELPWRGTSDAYAIWLSEIILQQTQVKQGWDYWERFMRRWPTVELLAKATEDEVLREWQGLGYYSRARNLHAAARQVVTMGGFPRTIEGLRQLKGVGDYTAAAIGSFAFGIPAAVVDGNVYRVLARFYGIATPVGTTAAKKEFTTLAQSLLPEENPGDFNQAMMDFGALQCTPQNPHCLTCPLAARCDALRTGRTALLPVRRPATAVQTRRLHYVYIRCHGLVAFRRRGPGDIWQGLWEPYLEESDDFQGFPGMRLLRSGVKHQLTHRTLLADFYLYECEAKPSLADEYVWIPEAGLDQYAKPRLIEILLDSL